MGELSIWSLSLEIGFDEAKEAELIKGAYEKWGEVKPKFRKIMGHIRKPDGVGVKKERGYFG
jgi:hypothetical protein